MFQEGGRTSVIMFPCLGLWDMRDALYPYTGVLPERAETLLQDKLTVMLHFIYLYHYTERLGSEDRVECRLVIIIFHLKLSSTF